MIDTNTTPLACCAPLAAPTLSDEDARVTAELFKALADPARVKVVNAIAAHGGTVGARDLYGPLGLAQPTVSHHLRRLVEAGLLRREQHGRRATFSITPDAAARLARVVDLKGCC